MSTKIDAYTPPSLRPVATGASVSRAGASGGAEAKPVGAVAAADSVSLTGNARELQKLAQATGSTPSQDSSRVDRIRQAVSNGSYQVDSKAVAAKLARLEFAFGGA